MIVDDRISRIEEAVLIMKDLIIRHDERLNKHDEGLDSQKDHLERFRRELAESREDFNFKLNAIIDLQMTNETDIRDLRESTKRLSESTTELKEASRSQLTRIENLESN